MATFPLYSFKSLSVAPSRHFCSSQIQPRYVFSSTVQLVVLLHILHGWLSLHNRLVGLKLIFFVAFVFFLLVARSSCFIRCSSRFFFLTYGGGEGGGTIFNYRLPLPTHSHLFMLLEKMLHHMFPMQGNCYLLASEPNLIHLVVVIFEQHAEHFLCTAHFLVVGFQV